MVFPSPFQSTHPLRGATSGQLIKIAALHISIHAPLAGCDGLNLHIITGHGISIHAPLAGCDNADGSCSRQSADFNPRTPCGVRLREQNFLRFLVSFQSTHPSRGATTRLDAVAGRAIISIHAPLAGCDPGDAGDLYALWGISIHAPLAGCDVAPFHARVGHTHFNPRTPCGVPVFPRRNSNTSQAPDTPSVREKMRISRVTRRSPRLSVNPPLWAFS